MMGSNNLFSKDLDIGYCVVCDINYLLEKSAAFINDIYEKFHMYPFGIKCLPDPMLRPALNTKSGHYRNPGRLGFHRTQQNGIRP